MKKKIILAFLILFAGLLFAKDFTIVGVTGKVLYESSPNTWIEVSKGDILDSSSIISVGLNSKAVVKDEEGKTYSIKPMQKGRIENLISSVAKGKLNVTKGEVANYVTVKSKGISTASSRASEAKEDLDWDE